MSYPVFYVPSGDVLPVMFATFDGGTGASVTLTGLAVTDVEIYKDGGTTQRASDAGYTLLDTDGIDFDSVTGIHGFSIDTGDNTDSGFYTVGSWFTVVVSSVTVDAQTVNFIACQFRLMPAEGVAGHPKVDVGAFGGTAGTFASGRPEADLNLTQALDTTPTADTVGDALYQSTLEEAPKKNTALSDIPFLMVDETDGYTGETGLTVTAEVSKDGGAFASAAGTVTEIGNGVYHFDATAADMNADVVVFKFTATGARAAFVSIQTVE